MIQIEYDPILGAQVTFIEEFRRRVDNPDLDVDGFNDWLDEKLEEIKLRKHLSDDEMIEYTDKKMEEIRERHTYEQAEIR